MGAAAFFPLVVVIGSALFAAAIDIRKFRVPNYLTVPLLVSGVVYSTLSSGAVGLQSSLLGVAFGFFVIFVLYLMGGMGAGDVKYMAAVGAWLGMPATLYVFVVAAFATAIYSVILLLRYGGLSRAVAVFVGVFQIVFLQRGTIKDLCGGERVQAVVKREDRRKRLVPFAGMVALGGIGVIAWGVVALRPAKKQLSHFARGQSHFPRGQGDSPIFVERKSGQSPPKIGTVPFYSFAGP